MSIFHILSKIFSYFTSLNQILCCVFSKELNSLIDTVLLYATNSVILSYLKNKKEIVIVSGIIHVSLLHV